jgi:hypothetical protein
LPLFVLDAAAESRIASRKCERPPHARIRTDRARPRMCGTDLDLGSVVQRPVDGECKNEQPFGDRAAGGLLESERCEHEIDRSHYPPIQSR